MLSKLYYKFEYIAHYWFSCLFCYKSFKHYKHMYQKNGIKIQSLTRKEKQEIKRRWLKKKGLAPKGLYHTHKLYKSITNKFDVNVCPELLFRTKIEPKLINKKIRDAWDDKNLFEKVLPGAPFPKALVRNIYGIFYDETYNPIDFDTAVEIIKENLPVIIKPSIASGVARGIEKISSAEVLEKSILEHKDNFIIQKLIQPCEEFKKVSINAVPIIRVITFLIDGEAKYGSASLRTNTLDNAVADNFTTPEGLGMLIIGVDENGALKKTGVYSGGITVEKLPNDFEFYGMEIPKFEEIKEFVLNAQKKMPMFKTIGWDVTLDKDYNPIVMEYNLKGMGIYYYQLVNGPLFGEHTDKIIEKYL